MKHIHFAAFKWKPDVSPAQVDRVLGQTRALKHKVPGIESIYCGVNTSGRAPGFTHAVLVIFDSHEAIAAYNQHPDHKKVAHEIDAIMADSIFGIDYSD